MHEARRLAPAGIGSDTGGSVRIPSSFNGLVTIKATYGRVPNWPLVDAYVDANFRGFDVEFRNDPALPAGASISIGWL